MLPVKISERLFTGLTLTVLVAAFSLFICTLLAEGRTFLGSPGFGIWTWSATSPSTSQLLGDPYSFTHVLHGIILFGVLRLFGNRMPLHGRLLIATFIEMGWEILENSPFIIDRYRAGTTSLEYYGDSILNSCGDVLFMLIGFWLASKLPWKWAIAIVLAVELGMLAAYRDNLTLNVFMLVTPLDAVKRWQQRG